MTAIDNPGSSIFHRLIGGLLAHRFSFSALLAAVASLGASAIHLAVAPEHVEEWWGYGLFFVVVALFQGLYGVGLLWPRLGVGHERSYLLLGLTVNLIIIQFYIITRTVGIPLLGPHAGEIEAAGVLDLICCLLEIAAVIFLTRLVLQLGSSKGSLGLSTSVTAVISLILLVLTLSTGHSHTHSHERASLHEISSGHPRVVADHGGQADASPLRPHSSHTTMHVSAKPGGDVSLKSDSTRENVSPGPRCPSTALVRAYNLLAINVEITLNRFLDYDPNGRMYVLEEELERVRREETQNQQARADKAEPAVSVGLQGDAIQPLTIRANQGECLRVTLRNDLKNGEAASFHVHGSALYIATTGAPAIATNPDVFASPGQRVTYEWWVNENEPEGTHYFHSHGNTRLQTNHGLFGAVIVEPKNSIYLDPIRGDEQRSGWAVMIKTPGGKHFREFAFYYHEVGNERYRFLNKSGDPVIQVDPFTSAYRPGARAINYRSESFMNRLALQHERYGRADHSQAYSSYAFGDPTTPIARSYLGDPVKERVIHGGSEVLHVHHVHGGAIRWRRQPRVEPSAFDRGLDKKPPLLPRASERIDAQAIGPSEVYSIEHECGSGGCQQGAGDYLVHCHVAHHYLAGMWAIWRVYNTKQDGNVSQDSLPSLQELPDRLGLVAPAVTSRHLIGRRVDWKGKTFQISRNNLAAWVERQLPPPGLPKGYDASVLDWRNENDLYLNEPESKEVWPGFRSSNPETRLPIHFDPKTGKLAYPFLTPHPGKRLPFAPNHGPAPFLDPIHSGTDPPKPGENGPWSVCPAGTRLKEVVVHAITLPVTLNEKANVVDPVGQIYVLKQKEDAVRKDNRLKVPLAIRANAGEDCVDIVFKSELEDTRENGFFSKANIHIHFAQFDVQGSDGVSTGFSYEQSIRPFKIAGEPLKADAPAGATSVEVRSAQRFHPGTLVGVGMDQDKSFEVKRIKEIRGDLLLFTEPLRHSHAKEEIVSAEFVRYRWYPDVQFGTAYFHDHVSALISWKHGLFGALIVEPPGSKYRHPHTGEEISSGPIADIHTQKKVSADVTGSFRELVLFIQDDQPLTQVGKSSGSSFNLRAEPLAARGGDPWNLFSSKIHGDPATPLLEAFAGDPLVIRALVSGTNDVHTLHTDGHWFRSELWSKKSAPTSTIQLGISERYDLVMPKAGGSQALAGDYRYYNGRSFKLREGSWGIIRVRDSAAGTPLRKLPGRNAIPRPAPGGCPASAPRKPFAVAAIETPLPMLGGANGKIYVLQQDKAALRSGAKTAEPLALHVNIGDCVEIHLTNDTKDPVSFHPSMLAYDPRSPALVEPGKSQTFTFYAHPEVGETAALVRDWGNVVENPGLGLYGAIVIGPRGATYKNPVDGSDMSLKSGWSVKVYPPSGIPYRDFTLFIQDQDEIIGTAQMPYTEQVQGTVGLNYRAESLLKRLTKDKDPSKVFRSDIHGTPSTPIMEAFSGDAVKIHVLVPFSEQSHVFSIEGHRWPFEPGRAGTDMLSSVKLGGMEAMTISLARGAGGRAGRPGDYLYGDHREPYRDAGVWGIFRVYAPGTAGATVRPLSAR